MGSIEIPRPAAHRVDSKSDREIAWAGSLNIMSHRDSSELTFSLANRKVHDRLAQFASAPQAFARRERGGRQLPPLGDPEPPHAFATGAQPSG